MIDREKLVSEMRALIALGPYQGVAAERIMQCMKDAVTLLSLAKPASSPAGGDVREAFETCAAICEARAEYFDRAPSYREWTDAARSYRATAKEIRERAALSPPTSAAEPVGPKHGPYRVKWLGAGVWAGINEELPAELEGKDVWLTTTPPAPAAVDGQRVKALKWTTICEGFVHQTQGGFYRIEDNGTNWTDERYWLFAAVGLVECHRDKFDTLEKAKAAAQEHHEARIRACLATDKEGA